MTYTSVTSFRRPMDAVQMARLTQPAQSDPMTPMAPVDKWQVLRDLGTARKTYGLSDRDLTVLQALISFHPTKVLDPSDRALVVHPSNASICQRLNGMPCSTMRRHLARLIDAGFLTRRDSPNGKRYVRRLAGARIAYGFDLSPLVLRQAEIAEAADQTRQQEAEIKALRDQIALMRRDLIQLAEYATAQMPDPLWDAFHDLARLTARTLRRRLTSKELHQMTADLTAALGELKHRIGIVETSDLSTSDTQIEQHIQSSDKDSYESEKTSEGGKETQPKQAEKPQVTLKTVQTLCPDIATFGGEPLRDWEDLDRAADRVGPMMGICAETLRDAQRKMGRQQAAVTVAAILQRVGEIKSPGAYLRRLAAKAQTGEFHVLPMLMALQNRQSAMGSQV